MTVGDIITRAQERRTADPLADKGSRTRPRVHANIEPTQSDGKTVSRTVRIKRAVVADMTRSWLWDAAGPTPRQQWADRMPDIERVPGANRPLWLAWVVFNHAGLVALFPAFFALYLLGHPARALLAAALAAPLIALWIY